MEEGGAGETGLGLIFELVDKNGFGFPVEGGVGVALLSDEVGKVIGAWSFEKGGLIGGGVGPALDKNGFSVEDEVVEGRLIGF